MTIALTHPGKIGDALWALPTARALCVKHGCPADFYTSSHCEPMRSLVEAQVWLRRFIIPASYEIKGMDMGVQPWEMPVDAGYEAVYHLGFRAPPDRCIGEFIALSAGLQASAGSDVDYDVPAMDYAGFRDFDLEQRFIVLATRGETSYSDRFRELCDLCPVPVLTVGAFGQFLGKGVDMSGLSMLQMAQLMKRSIGFVGLMSAPLVVANGFPIPKVVPHNGRSWDMRHVLNSTLHHYLVEPTAKQMIEALAL